LEKTLIPRVVDDPRGLIRGFAQEKGVIFYQRILLKLFDDQKPISIVLDVNGIRVLKCVSHHSPFDIPCHA